MQCRPEFGAIYPAPEPRIQPARDDGLPGLKFLPDLDFQLRFLLVRGSMGFYNPTNTLMQAVVM
jgi:hypothetical protein